MLDSCKMVEKQSEAFHTLSVAFFPSLKQNFIAYHSSKVSSHLDSIFEIHQLWQSGFSRMYSNCCCSCSFEPEIIKIGWSSHKMYSNNILNSQESTTILNACTKKVWKPHFWPSKPLAGLGRIWNRYLLTMLTWNCRDSTPLSTAPWAPKGISAMWKRGAIDNNYGRQ